jgi:alanyl-tRNA synthetase
MIKIIGIERLQDGIERIRFSCGESAIKDIQERERMMNRACDILNVGIEQLPTTVKKFFDQWKKLRKEVEKLKGEKAKDEVSSILGKAEKCRGVSIVADRREGKLDDLIKLAGELIKNEKVIAILGSKGKIVVARSKDVDIDCREIVKESARSMGGSGGGKSDMAQGGGPNADKIEEAIDLAKKMVKEKLIELK